MRHTYAFIFLGILAAASCSKESCMSGDNPLTGDIPIVFEASSSSSSDILTKSTAQEAGSPFSVSMEPVEDLWSQPQTKVTATTTANLSGFYLTVTSGSANTLVSTNSHYTLSSGTTFTPDAALCWPSSNPSYRFYASNQIMAASTGSVTVACPEDTDVVCARNTSPTYLKTNSLSMAHVYSRIGTIGISVPSGVSATLSGASVTAPKSGTYNIIGSSWSSKASSKSISLGASNDVWIVPGTYPMSVTFSLTDGYTTKSGIVRSGNVTFTTGMVNNITVNTTDCFSYSAGVTPSSATLEVGDTQSLAMTLTTSFGGSALSTRTVTGSATWSSSSTSVATVSSSGVVTARAEGTATITGTFSIGGTSVSATSVITVEDNNWSVVID